tara:strand:- start:1721 stop:2437 length:717 start_codon:yes stop_codon:yes gene_type:complete
MINLAVWSGPRNISTALMYSFGNRDDFEIIDEPFYGNYLIETGLDHPKREEIISSQPKNVSSVIDNLTQDRLAVGKNLYQKHMTKHMVDSVPRDWLGEVNHVFLLRHPARVISSFVKKYNKISEEEVGLKKQVELFLEIKKRGLEPVVVNSEDIRKKPEDTLTKLCERINLDFKKSMLSWPRGGHKNDGVWASHWYESAHKSTGFSGPEDDLPKLKGRNANIAKASMPLYHSLLKFAI